MICAGYTGRDQFTSEASIKGLEALQSVQFVSVQDRRLAVLDADDWESLIEWLETVEDVAAAKQASRELQAAGCDRQRAGWVRWDDVKQELQ